MSADGSDGDTKTKGTARRSGRPKKPRVVPEDEISADGKSEEEFEEPFEASEDDEDFEEESRPARKKPAARPAAAAAGKATPKGGKAAPAKGKKAAKEVEEDEEEEDVDGDLEDEDEEDMEGEEDEEEEFSEDESEEEGGKKKNGAGKKKRDKATDAEAAMDRAQYFPNASFVIAKKDKDATNKVDLELWRIDGKCMLQKFVGYTDEKDSLLKFKSTNAYTGWSALDKDDYMNINVVIDPTSTQSKVIVTVDADSNGATAEIKSNDIDIAIEDVK